MTRQRIKKELEYEYCPEVYLARKLMTDCFEITKLIVSLISYHIDFTSDIVTAIEHFIRGDILWGCLTVFFILYPALVCNLWNHGSSTKHFILSICFGPLHTSVTLIHILITRIRGKRTSSNTIYMVGVMKFAESLTEAMPQTCLQMYIITQTLCTCREVSNIQWISLTISIINFSLTLSTDTTFFVVRMIGSKLIFFTFGALAFTSRIMVCCMMSLIWKPFAILPLFTQWIAAVLLWSIKRYCNITSCGFIPLNENHRTFSKETFTFTIFPSWTLTTVFNSFTLSGLMVSSINLVSAMGGYWLSASQYDNTLEICLFKLLAVHFALVSYVANTVLATVPYFQYIRDIWLCINNNGESRLF